MKHLVKFIDSGRVAQCPPNPAYPDGIPVVDVSEGAAKTCAVVLPYKLDKKCGLYAIKCTTCDYNAVITVAGRPDDPRSVKLPCYGQKI